MRKLLGIAIATAIVASVSSIALAGIANSKHDLTPTSTDSGQDIALLTAICEPCHTPHATAATDAPLWNHAEPVGAFTAYTTIRDHDSVATGASKICLGCHDGATALDNYGGAGNAGAKMTAGYAIIGPTELDRNHPIGITYDDAQTGYVDDVTVLLSLRLPAGKIECQSCHDPHDDTVKAGSTVTFLRMANDTSQLCTTCHSL